MNSNSGPRGAPAPPPPALPPRTPADIDAHCVTTTPEGLRQWVGGDTMGVTLKSHPNFHQEKWDHPDFATWVWVAEIGKFQTRVAPEFKTPLLNFFKKR
ncbi:hypothetical protein OC834_007741, partial [Tilletia horrida]